MNLSLTVPRLKRDWTVGPRTERRGGDTVRLMGEMLPVL